MFRESIKMSWQNIVSNKIRSFLTILGILIGVSSVIALITIVQGITAEVTGQFSELGANTMTVQVYGTPLKDWLNIQDIMELESLPHVEGVSPTLNITGTITRSGRVEKNISIEGHNAVYFKQHPEMVAKGRTLNILDMADRNKVCLIDQLLVDQFWKDESPLNSHLQINGNTFTVVGILSDIGDRSVMKAKSEDDTGTVIVPYDAARLLSATGTIKNAEIFLQNTSDNAADAAAVKDTLDRIFRYEENSYKLINMNQLHDTMNSMTGTLTAALVGIASISLLVGGIGIMNMMLVSVRERTPEIGLRKALGADPSRIQFQFLIESVFLSLIGGTLGVILGVILSVAVCFLLKIGFHVSYGAAALGLSFSLLTGVLFGWVPARNASLLNPIDALRSQ